MTENECIKSLNGIYPEWCSEKEEYEMAQVAIQALAEIQAYRAIGTVKELQSMKEHGAFTGTELAHIAVCQMELQKYMSIGTIEEFKALKEKSVAKKPIILDRRCENVEEVCIEWKCPVCGLNVIEEPPCQEYCQRCGNKLDWE